MGTHTLLSASQCKKGCAVYHEFTIALIQPWRISSPTTRIIPRLGYEVLHNGAAKPGGMSKAGGSLAKVATCCLGLPHLNNKKSWMEVIRQAHFQIKMLKKYQWDCDIRQGLGIVFREGVSQRAHVSMPWKVRVSMCVGGCAGGCVALWTHGPCNMRGRAMERATFWWDAHTVHSPQSDSIHAASCVCERLPLVNYINPITKLSNM